MYVVFDRLGKTFILKILGYKEVENDSATYD